MVEKYKNIFLSILKTAGRSVKHRRIVLLAVLLGVFVLVLAAFQLSKPRISCKEAGERSSQYAKSIGSREELARANQEIQKVSSACESKKDVSTARSSSEDRLAKIEFFHNKATTSYMLGKFEEAKKDAEEALRIDATLEPTEKKLRNHSQIIKELEYVRDGKY